MPACVLEGFFPNCILGGDTRFGARGIDTCVRFGGALLSRAVQSMSRKRNVDFHPPIASRIRAHVTSSVSGRTRVSPITDTKFASATHLGRMCI